jgi:hypothetical protein
LLLGLILVGAALVLVACGGGTATDAVVATPEITEAPMAEIVIPFMEKWESSPHADATAEAFRHWDEEDPKEVPASCAKCHSETGYLDFLGADGSAAGTVDAAAPIGTVVSCVTCHNDATMAKTSVVFPSGVEVTGLGDESRCMECHQGRASTVQVNEAITKAAVADDDTVMPEQGFINIHYFPAGATLYGTVAQGGYQYDGQTYDAKFRHVEGLNTCLGCHDTHSLEVKVESCTLCHEGVTTVDDLKNVRMFGSLADYDGDGDVAEGVYYEMDGLRAMLLTGMQAYSTEVAASPIAYSADAYPYFFVDTNANGSVDGEEGTPANSFKSWTPRLLKAAYNYQLSVKDPGAFAHGGKYIMQLMYDSIASLNEKLATPVDLSTAHRTDPGHFAGSAEAFRHWDEDGEVPAGCAKCHSAGGLPEFLANAGTTVLSGTTLATTGIVAQETSNGFMCSTCHNEAEWPARYAVTSVPFPSNAKLTFSTEKDADGNLIPVDANLCLECHQGRESSVSIENSIKSSGAGDDEISDKLRFRNPHYFAAGATLFGGEAKGAYQYADQEYAGRNAHVQGFDTCTACHDAHELELKVEACVACHPGTDSAEKLTAIRGPNSTADYDGDGDITEGIAGEKATMHEALYAAIQKYAADQGKPVVVDPAAYPYVFGDDNANGTVDEGEAAYAAWTPRLLRAVYNYVWFLKDPGAFAHNPDYTLQVLFDSIADLGGSTAGMTRP